MLFYVKTAEHNPNLIYGEFGYSFSRLKLFNSTLKKPNLPRIGIGISNLFAWLTKKPYFGLL